VNVTYVAWNVLLERVGVETLDSDKVVPRYFYCLFAKKSNII